MASQVEHDLERVITAVDRVIKSLQRNEIDTAINRLNDIKDEVGISLLVMEGYSIEEAEEKIYE